MLPHRITHKLFWPVPGNHDWWLLQAHRDVTAQIMRLAERLQVADVDRWATGVLGLVERDGAADGAQMLRAAQMETLGRQLESPTQPAALSVQEIRQLASARAQMQPSATVPQGRLPSGQNNVMPPPIAGSRAKPLEGGVSVNMPSEPLDFGGRRFSKHELASLSGAPPGSQVEVRVLDDGEGALEIVLNTTHPELLDGAAMNALRVDPVSGRLVLYVADVHVKPALQGQGVGSAMFRKAAAAATELGFQRIELDASGVGSRLASRGAMAGDAGTNFWPRRGFNAPLVDADRQRMGARAAELGVDIAAVLDVQALIRTEAGQQLWEEYRTPRSMSLEL